ncbi:ROK family transcriptional regulator [Streptomyces sp. H39-S7]|uniref:ROK family transcriptional regulator n=1 Tax=Streptomyces sp. H39-S7 TaxID=3004357 RepID=UPI0022AE9143|nr:ROK family transcriptional regulator [Streptomyces sp. H39-S7]MCZ4122094.1 ROK family transcriptional regulator [Streptomyces sp. H39-S7]
MANGTGPQAALRRRNLSRVLHAVATGDKSRAAVAAEVGLTRATVSTLVDDLIAAGLVSELGAQRPGTVGRPGTALALSARGPAGIGAEVGVDHLAACVVDLRGTVRARATVESRNRGRAAAQTLGELEGLVRQVTEEAVGLGLRPAGLTVAVPGLVGRDHHTVLRAPNLGWKDERTTLTVENEANLGALAELWLSGGETPPGASGTPGTPGTPETPGAPTARTPLTDFIHVSAEIGIGAALVINGGLFRGARGFAGELGHVPVYPDGPRCSCGARGCLEQYAGEEAVLRAAGIAPELPGRLKALRTAAADDDAPALAALEAAGRALGIALSGAVNLLDPQAVVLGGPLSELAPWLLPGVRRELGERVTGGGALVVESRLGRDGVLLGAAYSAIRAVLDDPSEWTAR